MLPSVRIRLSLSIASTIVGGPLAETSHTTAARMPDRAGAYFYWTAPVAMRLPGDTVPLKRIPSSATTRHDADQLLGFGVVQRKHGRGPVLVASTLKKSFLTTNSAFVICTLCNSPSNLSIYPSQFFQAATKSISL
jgi:hypothetical protein